MLAGVRAGRDRSSVFSQTDPRALPGNKVGREEWLTPYTFATLQTLARQGFLSVDVVCPGFSADCLETLEEIAITNTKIYKKAGGRTLNYVPALNVRPDHIRFLAQLVRENAPEWFERE